MRSFIFILFIMQIPYSQGVDKINFYINIGLAKPVLASYFSHNWSSGYSLGVGIGKSLSTHFQVQAIFNFINLPLNNDNYVDHFDTTGYHINMTTYNNLSVSGGERNLFSLLARLKYMHSKLFNNKTIPYVIIGCGFFRQYLGSIKLVPIEMIIGEKTTNAFSSSAGLGLDILLEKHTNLFFEMTPEINFTKPRITCYLIFKIGFLIK